MKLIKHLMADACDKNVHNCMIRCSNIKYHSYEGQYLLILVIIEYIMKNLQNQY